MADFLDLSDDILLLILEMLLRTVSVVSFLDSTTINSRLRTIFRAYERSFLSEIFDRDIPELFHKPAVALALLDLENGKLDEARSTATQTNNIRECLVRASNFWKSPENGDIDDNMERGETGSLKRDKYQIPPDVAKRALQSFQMLNAIAEKIIANSDIDRISSIHSHIRDGFSNLVKLENYWIRRLYAHFISSFACTPKSGRVDHLRVDLCQSVECWTTVVTGIHWARQLGYGLEGASDGDITDEGEDSERVYENCPLYMGSPIYKVIQSLPEYYTNDYIFLYVEVMTKYIGRYDYGPLLAKLSRIFTRYMNHEDVYQVLAGKNMDAAKYALARWTPGTEEYDKNPLIQEDEDANEKLGELSVIRAADARRAACPVPFCKAFASGCLDPTGLALSNVSCSSSEVVEALDHPNVWPWNSEKFKEAWNELIADEDFVREMEWIRL